VLERFCADELKIVDEMIASAVDAVETVITDGVEAAQHKFN
jgi:peptidyl-tRNA hydrolase